MGISLRFARHSGVMKGKDDEHMLKASELCMIPDQEYGIRMDRGSLQKSIDKAT